MKLRVQANSTVEYALPKKRSLQKTLLAGSVEVELREVSGEDAPVAHVVHDRSAADDRRDYQPFVSGDGKPCEVRHFEGGHWARRMPLEEFVRKAEAAGEDSPFNGIYTDGTQHFMEGSHPGGEVFASREAFEAAMGLQMRKWDVLSDRSARAISGRAASFLVVEGSVYERVGEPVLTLTEGENGFFMTVTEAVPFNDGYHRGNDRYRPLGCLRFGVDEQDRADETGRRLAASRECGFDPSAEALSCSPWHVRFRGEPEAVTARAKYLSDALRDQAAYMDHLSGRAWHDLSTALSFRAAATAPAVDAARRLEAMSDRLVAARGTQAYGAGTREVPEGIVWAFARMKEALDCWDGRDPQGVEWSDGALGGTAAYDSELRAYEVTSLMEADAIATRLGSVVQELAAEAAAGRGSLIAVEETGVTRSAFFVSADEDGSPAITGSVTAHGVVPSQRQAALAMRFYEEGKALSAASEAELDGFGI